MILALTGCLSLSTAAITDFLTSVNDVLWGPPMLILLVGTGVYLTIALRGIQFRKLLHALYLALIKRREEGAGDISHFQALMTALSATVGTGNIAGVATAIVAGGPGALFWMWVTGLFGMATKYGEAVLAVKYRSLDSRGEMCGGPMYYIWRGLNQKWLASAFALFASLAAFGIGCVVQSNSVALAVHETFNVPQWITGLVIAVATGAVILGGIKSIGRVTGVLVPIMIGFYMLAAILAIIFNWRQIPDVFSLVITHAFTPMAAGGGFAGYMVKDALRFGVARGVFSNESGLGSSPIAAAAAQTNHPVTQALVSMTQTFIDTIVVCTMTGFVILSSGLWTEGASSSRLTTQAFDAGLHSSLGALVVTVGLVLFAYSTILGWSYYGEKSLEFLFGERLIMPYRLLFCVVAFLGTLAKIDLVWQFADTMNGLMALPNLIGLIFLSGVIIRETREYFPSKK